MLAFTLLPLLLLDMLDRIQIPQTSIVSFWEGIIHLNIIKESSFWSTVFDDTQN